MEVIIDNIFFLTLIGFLIVNQVIAYRKFQRSGPIRSVHKHENIRKSTLFFMVLFFIFFAYMDHRVFVHSVGTTYFFLIYMVVLIAMDIMPLRTCDKGFYVRSRFCEWKDVLEISMDKPGLLKMRCQGMVVMNLQVRNMENMQVFLQNLSDKSNLRLEGINYSHTYKVTQAYRAETDNPIILTQGQSVQCLEASDPEGDWPNWRYCKSTDKAGWVPAQIIQRQGDQWTMTEDYSAQEFNLEVGDRLISEKTLNGWIWAYKVGQPDTLAWAPLNHLEKET